MKRAFLIAPVGLALGIALARAEPATKDGPPPVRSSVKLGWPADAKLLIIHADDAGMCQAANKAIQQAFADGTINSCSIMMPCPWAYDFCMWAKAHSEYDVGLHITLNSEWKTYKWRSVSAPKDVPSLCDRNGFLLPDPLRTALRAKPDEVEREIRAQVQRAIAWGIKPTHLDPHLGAALAKPAFAEAFVKVGREFGVTPLLIEPGPDFRAIARRFGAPITPKMIEMIRQSASAKLDYYAYPHLLGQRTYDARKAAYVRELRRLKPGVSEIIVHPMMDTSESRATSRFWQVRAWEWKVFADPEVRQLIKDLKIERVTWKDLNDRCPMPKPATTATSGK